MKKYLNIFLAIAACSFVLASCQKEKEDFTPGDPDVSTCYGVFFPSQDASGAHTYDPEMEKSVEITVARSNSSGAISDVPVTVTETADGEPVTGVFSVAPISFADGQTETTVKVTFSDIAVGVNYGLSLAVTDPQYASQYKEGAVSFDFSVLCVKWEYFLNPKTGEKAVFTFTQDWWGETAWAYIKYYEVDGKRTCMTETFLHDYAGSVYDDPGFWGYGSDYEWTFIWYTKYQNDNGYDLIRIPLQKSGYHHSSYDADVYVLDYFYWNADDPDDEAEFLSYAADNGDVVSYYDGNGGFFLSVRSYYMFGVGGWNPGAYDTIGIAEGFDRPDYSISLSSADPENYVTKVTVTTGPTVDYIVYDVFEGTLNSSQIESKFVEFGENPSLGKKVDTNESGEMTLDITAENTGTYTLVAVSFGEDVETHEVVAKEFDSVSFKCEAEGQEVPVEVACGIDEVSAVNQNLYGVNPETSLEFYVYGEDLVDVKIAAISYLDIASKGVDACAETVSKASSVSADVLAQINDGGYADITTGLVPGTEFYLFVYASNGYESTVIMSETSATTSGDPLMIYRNFSAADIDADNAPASSEGYFGTYNFYAINYFDNTTGLRDYAGKVQISDSEVPDSEPDDYGIISEYVEISGMFADAADDYGFDDTQLWEFYDGFLYNLGAEGQQLGETEGGYYAQLFVLTSAGSIYRGYPSMLIGGYVDDGYIAFVSSELYNGGALGENGLFLRFYSNDAYSSVAGNVDGWTDLLLVDETKDDNGIAPAAISARKARIRAINNALQEKRTNFVETDRGYIRSIIDKNKVRCTTYFTPAGLNLQREVKAAPVKVSVSSTPAKAGKKAFERQAPVK